MPVQVRLYNYPVSTADETTDVVSESAARAASDVRAVVGRLRRRLREQAGDDDLTPSQSAVLSRLDAQGAASISDLAAAERMRHQSMAATVAALALRGLIEQRPDPDDGRRQVLTLSDAGRELLQGTRRVRQEWLARTLHERCTEEQRQAIIEALGVLDRVTQP